MPVCPSCNASNPPEAKFCNQCGRRLDGDAAGTTAPRVYTPRHLVERVLRNRSALVGERKRVTVLFVDIKGSTRLAEQAGAEAWHLVLDHYFGLLSGAVHRYEGTVNQYTGDGIMALFGAPVAHEDHALRACFAALEMQREVRRYADELRLSSGLNLSIRVGLNTGEVIVGAIGDDLRMDYTAQGLTVNLAARMEHICEPGRIYATRNTAVLAEGYFRLRDLGEMAVAGMDTPLRVYEVEGEGAVKTRLERGLQRGVTPFVGRDAEREQLRAALQEARAGRGQILAVVGEAGIGKSRLCHEFAQECERTDIAAHRATGVPYASALPFYPVQMLTRRRLGLPDEGRTTELKRLAAGALLLFDPAAVALLPRLLEFLGAADAPGGAGGADRRQLFGLLARLLPRADAPQVLLVEDLHFADAGSEAFLKLLAQQVAGTQTLLLFNFRPDYAAAWLDGIPHRRLHIGALDHGQIETVARELLGTDPALEELAQELGRRAAGNPFYVEEAVQALAETGHLEGATGDYRLAREVARWPIPDTVHALVAARIDRLDEANKTLLQAAAIIGLEFPLTTLARLAERSPAQCAESLAVLQRSGFVQPKADAVGVYAFSHPLSQDVVYHTQLETQRSAAHRRLAGLLEEEHPGDAPPDEVSVAIAHHWRRAGEWLRATEWNLRAARWSANHGANATLAQFRQAQKNLARVPPSAATDRLRIQALAGVVRMAQFTDVSTDEVQRTYGEARALAEANRDTAALAELLISYAAEQLHQGDAEAAVAVGAEAVKLAVDSGARDLINRFRLQLLVVHSTAGYPREGVELISVAGGSGWLTEPIGPDNFMSRAFNGLMLCWLGRLDEANTQVRAALAYAEQINQASSWMHTNWIDLASFSGDYGGVLQHGQLALQRAESWGSSYFRAIALRGLGLAHVLQGDAATAVNVLEQALPLVARGANGYQFHAQTLATLARAYVRAGAFERASEAAAAAIASAQTSHSRVWEINCWLAYFELPEQGPWNGRMAEGIARVAELIEATGAEGTRPWWWLAQARCATDPAERAALRGRALDAFARIGAQGHVRRLSAQAA
ncbi:MAG: adenylate/guanylate cyclase domain-containing protein [Nevskia sp.]|nr:adenylate/guanylate cyclase domain-containing protein [Nevskia sp.]